MTTTAKPVPRTLAVLVVLSVMSALFAPHAHAQGSHRVSINAARNAVCDTLRRAMYMQMAADNITNVPIAQDQLLSILRSKFLVDGCHPPTNAEVHAGVVDAHEQLMGGVEYDAFIQSISTEIDAEDSTYHNAMNSRH